MKASVIIPTKNPGEVFKEVLPSVLGQNVNFYFDVLVIDSGSTDGTTEYVKSLADARLRLHCIDPLSFGHGRTRNLGVAMTEGEYAILITHDAMPTNDQWLSNLVAAAEADPQVAGVFGRHIAYPSASIFTKRELEMHFSGFSSSPLVRLDDPDRYARDPGYRQFLHFFSDNNALIRRSVWSNIPYPDVDFAEDQIWAQKIIEAGFIKAYAQDAVVYHSHDYSIIERLQRSFDESYAFHRLFGYVLCPSSSALFRSWLALNARDFAYAKSQSLWLSHLGIVLRMPFDNLMRVFGHYLGARGERLPHPLLSMLSWDQRLMHGLRSASRGDK